MPEGTDKGESSKGESSRKAVVPDANKSQEESHIVNGHTEKSRSNEIDKQDEQKDNHLK